MNNFLGAKYPAGVFIGAATVEAGRGGIARVARLMIKVLADHDLEAVSLLDARSTEVAGLPCQGLRGNRLIFAGRAHLAAVKGRLAIYDSAGIARAHPRFPFFPSPYAAWIHGIDVWEGLRTSRRRAIKSADLILVNSQYTLSRYRNLHGDLPRAVVCWLATEDNEPPTCSADFSGPPTVLMLSRIELGESYKGHDHVIAAWPDVIKQIPDARLIIVGSGGGVQRVRELVSVCTASESITMTGFVPEGDILKYWRKAHVFCMPSTCEGFGLVYVEAMRYGLPVIASVHDAGQEINAHGVSGFNVNLNSVSELTSRLIELLSNREYARTMGMAGLKRWSENFNYTSFQRRFSNAIGSKF